MLYPICPPFLQCHIANHILWFVTRQISQRRTRYNINGITFGSSATRQSQTARSSQTTSRVTASTLHSIKHVDTLSTPVSSSALNTLDFASLSFSSKTMTTTRRVSEPNLLSLFHHSTLAIDPKISLSRPHSPGTIWRHQIRNH